MVCTTQETFSDSDGWISGQWSDLKGPTECPGDLSKPPHAVVAPQLHDPATSSFIMHSSLCSSNLETLESAITCLIADGCSAALGATTGSADGSGIPVECLNA